MAPFGDPSAVFVSISSGSDGAVTRSQGPATLIRSFVDRVASAAAPPSAAAAAAVAVAFTRTGQRVPVGVDSLAQLASGAAGAEVLLLQACPRAAAGALVVDVTTPAKEAAAAGKDASGEEATVAGAKSARARADMRRPESVGPQEVAAARQLSLALVAHAEAALSCEIRRATLIFQVPAAGAGAAGSELTLTGVAGVDWSIQQTIVASAPPVDPVTVPIRIGGAPVLPGLPPPPVPAAPSTAGGSGSDSGRGGMSSAAIRQKAFQASPLPLQLTSGSASHAEVQQLVAAAIMRADVAAMEAATASQREVAAKKRSERLEKQVQQLTEDVRILGGGGSGAGSSSFFFSANQRASVRRSGSFGPGEEPSAAGGSSTGGSALARGGRAVLGVSASGEPSGLPPTGPSGGASASGSAAPSPSFSPEAVASLESQVRTLRDEVSSLREAAEVELSTRQQLTAANAALIERLGRAATESAQQAAAARSQEQQAGLIIRDSEMRAQQLQAELAAKDAAMETLDRSRENGAAMSQRLRDRVAELEGKLAAARADGAEGGVGSVTVADAIAAAVREAEDRVRVEMTAALRDADLGHTARLRALDGDKEAALVRARQLAADCDILRRELDMARSETRAVRDSVIIEAESALATVKERFAAEAADWSRQRLLAEQALADARAEMAARARTLETEKETAFARLAQATKEIDALKRQGQSEALSALQRQSNNGRPGTAEETMLSAAREANAVQAAEWTKQRMLLEQAVTDVRAEMAAKCKTLDNEKEALSERIRQLNAETDSLRREVDSARSEGKAGRDKVVLEAEIAIGRVREQYTAEAAEWVRQRSVLEQLIADTRTENLARSRALESEKEAVLARSNQLMLELDSIKRDADAARGSTRAARTGAAQEVDSAVAAVKEEFMAQNAEWTKQRMLLEQAVTDVRAEMAAKCKTLENELEGASGRLAQANTDRDATRRELESLRSEAKAMRESLIMEAEAALGSMREQYAAEAAEWIRQRSVLEQLVADTRSELAVQARALESEKDAAVARANHLGAELEVQKREAEAAKEKAKAVRAGAMTEVEAALAAAKEQYAAQAAEWARQRAMLEQTVTDVRAEMAARSKTLENERDSAFNRANQLSADFEAVRLELEGARAETVTVRGNVIMEAEAALAQMREQYAAEAADWIRQRSMLEQAVADTRAEMASAMAQRDRVAVAAMEELRQEVLARYTADIDALKVSHGLELAASQVQMEAALAAEKQRHDAELAEKIHAAVRNAESSSSASQSQLVTDTLTRAKADMERALQSASASHQREIEALSASHQQRIAEMQATMDGIRKTYNKELGEVKGSLNQMIPATALDLQRVDFEYRATAAMTEAVSQAVEAVRSEAQAAINHLQQQLQETQRTSAAALEQARVDRERALKQAETFGMLHEDTLATAWQRYGPNVIASQVSLAQREVEALLEQQLRAAEKAAEEALQSQAQAMQAKLAAAAAEHQEAKAAWEKEKGALADRVSSLEITLRQREEELATVRTKMAETETLIDAAKMAVQREVERENQLSRGLDEQRATMRAAFDAERAQLEEKRVKAVEVAVNEIKAKAELAHRSSIEELRREQQEELRAANELAAARQAEAMENLEMQHKELMEQAFAAALADKQEVLSQLERERAQAVAEAEERGRQAVLEAQAAHQAALQVLAEQFEQEKRALAEAAAQDIARALEATQAEMANALRAAEASWQERVNQVLVEREAAEQAVRQRMVEQHAVNIARVRENHNRILMGYEDKRIVMLEEHAVALREVVNRGLSEAEAETVAALGVFNQEWQRRLDATQAELLHSHQAEVARMKEDHARELRDTVQRLEQQRAAALEAILSEAEAERVAAAARHARELEQAVEEARMAGEAKMAALAAEAAAERDRALAEVAARAAQERAAAIAAVREQANAEHEEAMDALRMESDRLLAGIEGAMVKLRDERDAARQAIAQLQNRIGELEGIVDDLNARIESLRKAGGLQRLLTLALAARYASHIRRELERARAEAEAALASQAADFTARLNFTATQLQLEREKTRALLSLRASLQETLTSFKRDTVLEHKVKTMELAGEIAGLADAQADLAKQNEQVLSQLSEMEGAVRTIEREITELSKQSVIMEDGSVNVQVTRKKKRLDRDLDAAIARLADRRTALDELKRRLGATERDRQSKEDELRGVEADLIATLVMQQRSLMSTLNTAVVPPGGDMENDHIFLAVTAPHLLQQQEEAWQQQQQQWQNNGSQSPQSQQRWNENNGQPQSRSPSPTASMPPISPAGSQAGPVQFGTTGSVQSTRSAQPLSPSREANAFPPMPVPGVQAAKPALSRSASNTPAAAAADAFRGASAFSQSQGSVPNPNGSMGSVKPNIKEMESDAISDDGIVVQ
jgi:hypothetical protein